MQNQSERQVLERLLFGVRRRIFLITAGGWLVQTTLLVTPVVALIVAADQRWNQGGYSGAVMVGAACAALLFSAWMGFKRLGHQVGSALTVDQEAHLCDRVSSAWEFLQQPELTEAQNTQIRDAIQRAQSLNYKQVLRFQWPRFAAGLPVVVVLLVASFMVRPLTPAIANQPKDLVKEAQLQQLDELRQELLAKEELPKELQEVLKKLDEIQRQFEKGEASERDVMLQLGRLDENLRSKLAEMGVENLEAEMHAMVPHLSANAATLQAAQAIKEKKLDEAAAELEKLAEKVQEKKLSKEEQKQIAAHLGAAASKLGKKSSSDSFSGDLAQASEALEKSDCEGLKSACKSMGNKLGLLKKCQGLKSACNSLGLCKAGLGQCSNKEFGYKTGPKTVSKGKGGLKAGTATSGDPYGDPSRLADSYKKMLQIAGQAGQGPTESETEITEGQMSKSQLNVKEVHANYAALAEEVIEKEDIPLSHRYHVKRYFQAIRPQD